MARLGRSYAKRPVILNGAFFPGQIAASYLTLYPTSTSTSLAGGYSGTVMADNPIRYYRLDEPSGTVATDQMGNFNGTYLNTGQITYAQTSLITGDADTSVHFSVSGGVQGNLRASDNPALTACSIEFWLQKHGSSIFIFDNGDNFASPVATMWMWIDSGARLWFHAPGALNLESIGTLADDTPIHIVGTAVSSGTADLFVNGVDQFPGGTPCTSFSHFAPSGFWRMGAGSVDNFSIGDFIGTIDEFAIYDYALSPSQVLAHYNAAF